MAITITVPPSTTKLIALADLKALLGITDSANDTLLGTGVSADRLHGFGRFMVLVRMA
jgi:hypothetical protein